MFTAPFSNLSDKYPEVIASTSGSMGVAATTTQVQFPSDIRPNEILALYVAFATSSISLNVSGSGNTNWRSINQSTAPDYGGFFYFHRVFGNESGLGNATITFTPATKATWVAQRWTANTYFVPGYRIDGLGGTGANTSIQSRWKTGNLPRNMTLLSVYTSKGNQIPSSPITGSINVGVFDPLVSIQSPDVSDGASIYVQSKKYKVSNEFNNTNYFISHSAIVLTGTTNQQAWHNTFMLYLPYNGYNRVNNSNETGFPDISNYSTTNTSFNLVSGSTLGVGQSFTGNGRVISRASFGMAWNTNNTVAGSGSVYAAIYTHSGSFNTTSGVASGSALATSSNSTSASVFRSCNELQEFNFNPPFQTINGTRYVIALLYTGSLNTTSILRVMPSIIGSHEGTPCITTDFITWTYGGTTDLSYNLFY